MSSSSLVFTGDTDPRPGSDPRSPLQDFRSSQSDLGLSPSSQPNLFSLAPNNMSGSCFNNYSNGLMVRLFLSSIIWLHGQKQLVPFTSHGDFSLFKHSAPSRMRTMHEIHEEVTRLIHENHKLLQNIQNYKMKTLPYHFMYLYALLTNPIMFLA